MTKVKIGGGQPRRHPSHDRSRNCVRTDRHDCGGPNRAQWVAACSIIIDNPRENPKARIKALKFRGVAHHFQGDFAAAIADFSAVLALDPNDFEALSDRGLAYQALGDSDRALADDDKAIAVNPKFAFAYFNRAIVEELKNTTSPRRGRTTTKQSGSSPNTRLSQEPRTSPAAARRHRRRDRRCEIAIGINDSDPDVFINRGNAYRRLNALDKALADYEGCDEAATNLLRLISAAATCAECRATTMRPLADSTPRSNSTRRTRGLSQPRHRAIGERRPTPAPLRPATRSCVSGPTTCRFTPTAASRALRLAISQAPLRISSMPRKRRPPIPMCRCGVICHAPASARRTPRSSNAASNQSTGPPGRLQCLTSFWSGQAGRGCARPRPRAMPPDAPTAIARRHFISASSLCSWPARGRAGFAAASG